MWPDNQEQATHQRKLAKKAQAKNNMLRGRKLDLCRSKPRRSAERHDGGNLRKKRVVQKTAKRRIEVKQGKKVERFWETKRGLRENGVENSGAQKSST